MSAVPEDQESLLASSLESGTSSRGLGKTARWHGRYGSLSYFCGTRSRVIIFMTFAGLAMVFTILWMLYVSKPLRDWKMDF